MKTRPGIRSSFHEAQQSVFKAPEGFWIRCPSCQAVLQQSLVASNQETCTECVHHFRIGARARLDLILDPGSVQERDEELSPRDFLNFYDSKSYADRLQASQKKNRPQRRLHCC